MDQGLESKKQHANSNRELACWHVDRRIEQAETGIGIVRAGRAPAETRRMTAQSQRHSCSLFPSRRGGSWRIGPAVWALFVGASLAAAQDAAHRVRVPADNPQI